MVKTILLNDGPRQMTFEEVYKQFTPLIYNRVRRWQPYSYTEFEDLMQIARMGLWRAYTDYDINTGYKFMTKAVIWIDGLLNRNYRETYLRKSGRKDTQVTSEISLQALAYENDDDKALKLEDMVADEKAEKIIEYVALYDAINRLNQDKRKVINQRFFKGMTTTQMGKENGYSQVSASRHVIAALVELKVMMA